MSGTKKTLTIELSADLFKMLERTAKSHERDTERQAVYMLKCALYGWEQERTPAAEAQES
jgi:hypothetical protein